MDMTIALFAVFIILCAAVVIEILDNDKGER